MSLVRAASKPQVGDLLYFFAFGSYGFPDQPLQYDSLMRGFQMYAAFITFSGLNPADYGSALFEPGQENTLDMAGAPITNNSGGLVLNANFELVGMIESGGNGGSAYLGNYTRLDQQAANFNALLASIPQPPSPTAVVSRKEHGSAGTFDINLPLTGSPGYRTPHGWSEQ